MLFFKLLDFDECASSTCENRGTCVVVDDGFVCFCLAGWTGRRCEGSMSCAVMFASLSGEVRFIVLS